MKCIGIATPAQPRAGNSATPERSMSASRGPVLYSSYEYPHEQRVRSNHDLSESNPSSSACDVEAGPPSNCCVDDTERERNASASQQHSREQAVARISVIFRIPLNSNPLESLLVKDLPQDDCTALPAVFWVARASIMLPESELCARQACITLRLRLMNVAAHSEVQAFSVFRNSQHRLLCRPPKSEVRLLCLPPL